MADSTAWQRTNDAEPTPDLPKDLLYSPITGDGDFQYLSLEDRLLRLREHWHSQGWKEGFQYARENPPGELEDKIEALWEKREEN